MATSQEIAEYLTGLGDHIHCVRPCEVTVHINTKRSEVFPAAEYVSVTEIKPGCRAYQEGRRLSARLFIYCVGVHPQAVKRRGLYRLQKSVCYRRTDSELTADWYIACYWPDFYRNQIKSIADIEKIPHHTDAEGRSYQPHGANFMLAPWTCEDAIDRYERKAYERRSLGVTYLDDGPAIHPPLGDDELAEFLERRAS